MTPQTQQKTIELVKVAAALVDALMKRVAAQEKSASLAAEKAAAAATLLAEHNHIREDERTKAAEVLKDPCLALDVLRNVVVKVAAERVTSLGAPEGSTKTASANDFHSLNPSASVDDRPSGQRWLQRMGVAR